MEIRRKEDVSRYRILFYFVGIAILIIYHMKMDLSYGDVVNIYGNVLKRGSDFFPKDGNVFEAIYNFTKFHYLNWSSRNVIEIVLIIVGGLPTVIWHVLDILTVVLIGYCLEQLVDIKDEKIKYSCILLFLMMYKIISMRSAGWIATTINYSWVVAAGLYMFLNIQRIRHEEYIPKGEYLLSLLAAVYALNQEQMNGMMLIFLSLILVKDFKDNKIKKGVLPFWVINIAEFIIILSCPGNVNRKETEVMAYLPGYTEYSFLGKLNVGVGCLLRALFDTSGMLIITLSVIILLIYLTFKRQKSVFIKILSFIPVVYLVLRAFLGIRESKKANILGLVILLCLFLLCIIHTMGMEEQVLVLGGICAAAATKIVLGFSLAFCTSGERTSVYLMFALILTALFFIEKYEGLLGFLKEKWFYIVLCLGDVGLFVYNYYLICTSRVF